MQFFPAFFGLSIHILQTCPVSCFLTTSQENVLPQKKEAQQEKTLLHHC